MTGALKVGDRLEPSRELARCLGVHRTTVGNAYAELEAEGLIQGTVGRGTYVSPRTEGTYKLVVETVKPDVRLSKFIAQLVGVGGGWK